MVNKNMLTKAGLMTFSRRQAKLEKLEDTEQESDVLELDNYHATRFMKTPEEKVKREDEIV
jgi:hypothetical protein